MIKANTNILHIVVVGFLITLLCMACATPSGIMKTESGLLPRPGSKVIVKSVTNISGQTFEIEIEQLFFDALREELQKEGILAAGPSTDSDFNLDLKIVRYEPGNAFKRWLVPGWGSTVLEVEGDLTETKTGNHVASIKQDRSISAGGFYTLGAWSYIITQAAKNIAHELKIRIDKGGEFVISVSSRLAETDEAQPATNPILVSFAEIQDQRTEQDRIGERTAAFNVKMSDVYLNQIVDDYFMQALVDEVQLMGNKVVENSEDIKITPQLVKFWIATETTALYWDIVAEVECNLIFTSKQPEAAPITQKYQAKKTERTYAWPTSNLMSKVMNESLDDIFTQIRTDKIWKSFTLDANANND